MICFIIQNCKQQCSVQSVPLSEFRAHLAVSLKLFFLVLRQREPWMSLASNPIIVDDYMRIHIHIYIYAYINIHMELSTCKQNIFLFHIDYVHVYMYITLIMFMSRDLKSMNHHRLNRSMGLSRPIESHGHQATNCALRELANRSCALVFSYFLWFEAYHYRKTWTNVQSVQCVHWLASYSIIWHVWRHTLQLSCFTKDPSLQSRLLSYWGWWFSSQLSLFAIINHINH